MSLVTIPQVSAKLNLIQFPSRFLGGEFALSLGLIIARGRCVSGHVVRANFRSSRIRHQNALTEKAWEDAIQGPGKGRITVASCFRRLTFFATKPSDDEASHQILIKVRKPVINTHNDVIKEWDSQKHSKIANLFRQSKRGVGGRVWCEPLLQWYGHPCSQNLSDMGIACNPNPNRKGNMRRGCPYH